MRIGGWHGYFRGEPRAGEAWLSQDRHETIRYHDKTVPNRFVLITETRHFVLVTKIRQGSVGEGHEGLRKTVSAQAMGCGGRDDGGKVERVRVRPARGCVFPRGRSWPPAPSAVCVNESEEGSREREKGSEAGTCVDALMKLSRRTATLTCERGDMGR